MSNKSLLTPILDGGVRNTHFFQGRLLTAEDLKAEQDANRQHHRELGRAVGAGVIEGLTVHRKSAGAGAAVPVLEIRRGLAVNGRGEVLRLPQDTEIALAGPGEVASPESAGIFADCDPPVADPFEAGAGVFVLVMSPASGFREQAPKSGQAGNGKSTGCGSRWAVEGISFRLQQVYLNELTGISETTRSTVASLLGATDPRPLSRLRNYLAHLFFGTERLESFTDDPFARSAEVSPFLSYGALGDLTGAGRLHDGEVPLAVVYWSSKRGVEFVDMWSVRRRPAPRPLSEIWPTLAGARRRAEAEAVLLQFQEHVEDLLSSVTNPESIRAKSYFRYLPPAGFFPLFSASGPGLTDDAFFAEHPVRPSVPLEATRFDALIARSLELAPLDLDGQEPVWLYQVLQGADSSTADYRVFGRASLDFDHRPLTHTQFVPNLFGKTVAEARELLELEQFALRLATVLDIYGNVLNSENDEVQARLVLNQTPQPKALVPAGSSIQVAVTADAAVGEPAPSPEVIQYSPPQLRPGDSLAIIGAHFGPTPEGATVTFTDAAGNDHTAPVEPRSTESTLHLVVPATIPSPASGTTSQVSVTVTTAQGDTAEGPPLTLLPPPALIPEITGFPTGTVIEGDSVTLTGQNFDEDPPKPTQKSVFFGTHQAAVSAASRTSITATVPDMGLPSTSTTPIPTKVIVDGEESNVVSIGVRGYQPPPPPPPPAPVINSFSPTRTVKGNNVTIYGSSFDSDHTQNEVFFNTRKLIPSSGSTGYLVVYIPLNILPGNDADYHTFTVKVRAHGQNSNSRSYQVADFVPQPPPEEPEPPPGGHPL